MSTLLQLAAVAAAAPETDPFQWLEAVDDPRALETVSRWNQGTQDRLGADPRYAAFREEALAILSSRARIADGAFQGDAIVGFWRDAEHLRGLWRRASVASYLSGEPEWEVLLDLDALSVAEGENWMWKGATCAPDSDRCLVRLSRGGSDASVVREFDTRDGAFVDDGFRLSEAKSEVAWLDPDTLLVATERGSGSLTRSGYPRTVVRWARGTSLGDAPVVAEGRVEDMSVAPRVLRHGRRSVALVDRRPTFWESERSVLPDVGAARALAVPTSAEVVGLFGGSLLVELQEDWDVDGRVHRAGSLVACDLDRGAVSSVLQPGPSQVVQEVAIGRRTVWVTMLDDVEGRLVRLRPSGGGWDAATVPVPEHGVVHLASVADDRDDALVSFQSLTVPTTLLYVDARGRTSEVASLPAAYDASEVVVEQRSATSADGTRVPYWVMARRDVLEAGPAPTLQYGYGGFRNAVLPTYFEDEARPQHGALAGKLWVTRGGVLVLSNSRGGSEYGPAWHQAALKQDRQRAFDDFFAIGEALVADGVTTPEQLGGLGRSNGGLLMGVAMTQRPDLYAAIVCGVPLLDMLRYDQLLAGASWIAEYGDPAVPEERATLERYSPYQLVRAGVDYPLALFYTSTKDDRVHPGHARKMAAKLESLGIPFEYYENVEGGHGGFGNHEQAAHRIALELTHLAVALGLGGS